MSFLTRLIGDSNEKYLRSKSALVKEINQLEPGLEKLSDQEILAQSLALKERVKKQGISLEDLVLGFALVREAAKRTLGQRHFDVQLLGGLALFEGKIAEMKTGEGKTLAATLAAYLHALEGKGVHVVTVNDYLAKRDTIWMGQIYHFLGLKVSCIISNNSFLYDPSYQPEKVEAVEAERDQLGGFKIYEAYLRPISRKEAYEADITYGTNTEFGFDYLRDNLVYDLSQRVTRPYYYAIIDEVDSILIDEARTPLIISVPDEDAANLYRQFSKIVSRLKKDVDYTVDEKLRTVTLTEEGLNKVEKIFGSNIFDQKGILAVHYLEEALKAEVLFQRDRDYVVKDGEVIIVDEFTGRLLFGRRYHGGLHQAIEAKENVAIKAESRTVATITLQNYFRMYQKLAGMTGTAATSAEEFHKVYNLEVVVIPTNKPMIRQDLPDRIYRTLEGKFRALVQEIKNCYQRGQPVLVGTISIEKNEYLSQLLKREGIPHKVLNAKNHEEEGQIIAQAGRYKAVTIATNMAGRGVDIILGGNPPDPVEREKVLSLGGLHVIGTEHHEARRIDNQLRGRAGRQGDPGSSQFFVSLEDDLMRVFGSKNIGDLMQRFGFKEDEPIEHRLVSRAIESAQAKIEGLNFDLRKHILEFDDVLNRQRLSFYKERLHYLELADQKRLSEAVFEELLKKFKQWLEANKTTEPHSLAERLKSLIPEIGDKDLAELTAEEKGDEEKIHFIFKHYFEKKRELFGEENFNEILKSLVLNFMDRLWMDHLEQMEYLRDSVNLRAYGQKEPLVEYKSESYHLYRGLKDNLWSQLLNLIFRLEVKESPASSSKEENPYRNQKIGRNDPCPCGSGKKYKHCHGK